MLTCPASAAARPGVRASGANPASRHSLVIGLTIYPLNGTDSIGLHHIAHVTGGIPARSKSLALADLVEGRAREHVLAPALRREARRPWAEAVGALVRSEGRLAPVLATVAGEQDLRDAVAAVEGDALHLERLAALHARTVRQAGDEGTHRHPGDRHHVHALLSGLHAGAWVIRNPVGRLHPEVLIHRADDIGRASC